ncbi:thermonuclease family protein [Aeromicrobium sp. CF4.19]|uniref:thermonuclease family protein n=1 Tax=Aeromicrobium sp. CF4.19 TaxID=3373082 RepID=UPI003EE63140
MLGIDSPEEARDGRDPECGAIEATAAARNLLDGQDVDLIADDSQADADTYGRILRYVELDDGRDVGQELLRDGLATVYTPAGAIARQDAYDAAESDAREHGRGVSAC